MGSDSSPATLLEGVLKAAEHLKKCKLTVLATTLALDECQRYQSHPFFKSVAFVQVQEEVLMGESPLLVVRRKHKSSMAIGMKMLKEKKCDAFVSAGNTGAMTAYASLELDPLPGIDRPALVTLLPTKEKRVAILDVGANIALRPQSFMQFALLGAAYQQIVQNIEGAKVGLLNIGGEASKGTRKMRQVYEYFDHYSERLEESQIYFEGNVESRDVFEGKVDVVVTDGFIGNIFLKTCEGVSSFIISQIYNRFLKAENEQITAKLHELEKYLDYSQYPGAVLLGTEGLIVKCHGCSSSQAMFSGINGAYELLQIHIIQKMKTRLKEYIKDFSNPAV